MGLLGAAVGVAFISGPALGGMVIGAHEPDQSDFVRVCLLCAALAATAGARADDAATSADIERGRQIAHDVYKGNCLACHRIPGDKEAITLANIGPPLVAMRERFPDRAALRAQIWDSTVRNPETVMPPFGRHRVLTEEEIDRVVDYIYQY
jgi:sulfur-oxidizing protein SoxX